MEYFYNATLQVIDTTILDTDNPAVFEVVDDGLPLEPEYIVRIGSEYLRVTAVDTTSPPYQYTATRALEGSIAATHTAGDTVVHIVSAGGLNEILLQQNEHIATIDTALNREGRVQNADQKTAVDLGGAFEYHFVDRYKVTPIDFGDYTTLNADSATDSLENGTLRLKRLSPANAGYTLYAVTLGGDFTTSFNVAFQLATGAVSGEEVGVGLGVYDSSDDKHIVATHNILSVAPFVANKVESFSALTTLDTTNLALLAAYPASILFMRVTIDGTNVIFYYSYDNVTFIELDSVLQSYLTVTDFVIALSPYAVANIFHVGA